jgi:hypothetical protein
MSPPAATMRGHMRKILLGAVAALALIPTYALATMPALTSTPKPISLRSCQKWAAQQDPNAIEMWGIQEDGTTSRRIAIKRLTRSCLGHKSPEIVGFYSSAGFARDYCAKHPDVFAKVLWQTQQTPLRIISGAQAQTALPPVVQDEIDQARSACERAVLSPGFVTEKDINGDRIKDYILDYGKFECGGNSTFYCGSAGCLAQVFASLPGGGYIKVLDENVRNIKFRTIAGRPAMILDLHGSACGRVGAAPCRITLFWNGQTFNPAN